MTPTTGDWVFLGIGLFWCGLWAFAWYRGKRMGRRPPEGSGRGFLLFLQMGLFWWSNSNSYIRAHHPLLPKIALLGWACLILPEFRLMLRYVFADDKQKADISR